MSKEIKNKIVPKLRFPEFKDYKEWNIIPLGTAVKSESSTLAQNSLQLEENGFPVYGASGLIGYTSFFIQKEDYIAIIKDGSGVGKLFLYEKQSSILGTLVYLKSQDTETYFLTYLYYLLHTINLSSFIKGSGIPHIYYSDYSKELVATPTSKEQQKIASCLSSLDEYITAESEKLEALKIHKKGLMQQLFPAEGERVPKLRFPEFRGSGEWEEKKFGEVAIFLKGKGISKSDVVENGSLPCIRYGELYTYYSETIDVVKSYTNLNSDDLILSQANDVIIPASGETQIDIATASCVLKNGVVLGGDLNIIRTKINGIFLSYYLNNAKKKDIAEMAQGIPVVHLYPSQLKNLTVNIPKKDEQQKIAACLSSLDDLISAQTEKIEGLKVHKKGLMQGLFPAICN